MRRDVLPFNGEAFTAITRARLLSWAEVARRSGISEATISQIVRGRRRASFQTIKRMAEALDMAPETLIKK